MALEDYCSQILAVDDKVLFEEAVNSAKGGALRAAYLMVWISCAESLKRKFKEASIRDHNAGKCLEKIEEKEDNKHSSDKCILDQSLEYGFIDTAAHTKLLHIYTMRCLYGHPYEKAPTETELQSAAEHVVSFVLSQPTHLKYGFAQDIIKRLLEDPHYLDNFEEAVCSYAKELKLKISEDIYEWLLLKYWKELETLFGDKSAYDILWRGLWFSQAFLLECDTDFFSKPDWFHHIQRFPKMLSMVLSYPELFKNVDSSTQDYAISTLIDGSKRVPTKVKYLYSLEQSNVLTTRQAERVIEFLEEQSDDTKWLWASELSISFSFNKIIEKLKSYNWYTQKPVIDLIRNQLTELTSLDEAQQVEIGRNILQTANGGESSANEFLLTFSKGDLKLPIQVIQGLLFECFLNDDLEFRFKIDKLNWVLDGINLLDKTVSKTIIKALREAILIAKLKRKKLYDKDDFDEYISTVESLDNGVRISRILKIKYKQIFEEDDDK